MFAIAVPAAIDVSAASDRSSIAKEQAPITVTVAIYEQSSRNSFGWKTFQSP
jgi:hypothetical protein